MSSLPTHYEYEVSAQAGHGQLATRNDVLAASASPALVNPCPDGIGAEALSIAVIGPNEKQRVSAVSALAGCAGNQVREFPAYPSGLDDVPRLLEQHYDVIFIDMDSDPEFALELVESVCADGSATVMAYSETLDRDMLIRCMRAGAREFLTPPFEREVMAEALVRAAARRPLTKNTKKAAGQLLAFMGAKGGAGVTTLATNFAVALAQESNQRTLLIDLDLPLGDAALNLGIVPEFSVVDALQADIRLDATFLSQLLIQHTSRLSVLAAPGRFVQFEAGSEAIDRLLNVARQEFDNVVVDLGARFDFSGSMLSKEATTIFLVTQAGIPELRNSNRLIAQFFSNGGPKLEIVLNRYESQAMGITEAHITKALTRPAQWKIPNDYPAVRKMQVNATPLALSNSPIARLIRQMAHAAAGKTGAAGKPQAQVKKKGFSLFK